MDKSTETFAGHDALCVDDPIQFGVSAAQRLLRGKRVVIMGCSVQRDLYKDLVLLLQEQRYLSKYENRVKGSRTVVNDTLLKGGILEELKNDPSYREVREYRQGEFHIRFYFITRAYNPIVLGFVRNIYAEFDPDIFLFNSAIWDVNRNGPPFDHSAYEQNVRYICQVLVLLFSQHCRLIWLHQPPVTPKCATGRIVLQANQDVLKSNVLRWMYEAVCIAENITKQYGFETIDLYHLMKHRSSWIAKDGVHWASEGYRCMSLLVFHKLSAMYNIPLPEESVQYAYPSELSQEELNKVFDEDDNDIRYLYASKVESLTVFGDGDSKDGGLDEGGGGSVKPLIQLLDQHNFKKVVERNGLKDAVVCEEEIDGSFRTADEVQQYEEEKQRQREEQDNPAVLGNRVQQQRLRNFFTSNLSSCQIKVTVAPKARLESFFQKASSTNDSTATGSSQSNSDRAQTSGGGVSFIQAGSQSGMKPKRPSFIQSPEEMEEQRRHKEQQRPSVNRSEDFEEDAQQSKLTFLNQFNSQLTSDRTTSSVAAEQRLNLKQRPLSFEEVDAIEATATKVCKVNRLQQMFG